MKTSTANLIAEYKFQDRRNGIWLLPVICMMTSALMLMSDPAVMIMDGNVVHSLLAGSIIGALQLTYNWRNREINLLIFVVYLISFGMEFYLAGIPEQPIGYKANHTLGKGVMMDIFIYLLPYTYLFLKFCIALPLYLISKD